MNTDTVSVIRAFNRYYTSILGLLDQHVYESDFTLSEVRIMYELYHHKEPTAGYLSTLFKIDKGYLSRILQKFEKKKLLSRVHSKKDQRIMLLKLTAKGAREFQRINKVSGEQISSLISTLDTGQISRLIYNMTEIQKILEHKD